MTGKLPIFFLGLGKIFVTKYDKQEKITQLYFKIVIAKCDKELLQCVTAIKMWDKRLLQSVTDITKCDNYYKVRRNSATKASATGWK